MVYMLPKAGSIGESAISMELPSSTVGWEYRPIPPSEDEIGTLHPDTEFSKAICLKPREGEFNENGQILADRIDLSIVLSGADLNNSIHRPERCMPAQGHTITGSSVVEIHPEGHDLKATRLESVQTLRTSAEEKGLKLNAITYYFFVGHDAISNSHTQRTIIDMKDRLLKGMDQRWAYVSATTWYGKLPWLNTEVTQDEADKKIRQFLDGFCEKQIDWNAVK